MDIYVFESYLAGCGVALFHFSFIYLKHHNEQMEEKFYLQKDLSEGLEKADDLHLKLQKLKTAAQPSKVLPVTD